MGLAAESLDEDVLPSHQAKKTFKNKHDNHPVEITVDYSRDALITPFGRATLKDRYQMPGEGPQDVYGRVACWYADNQAHAQRLYDAMSLHWFSPATPILSNGGLNRGLPISCFLNYVEDDMDGIIGTWSENCWLAAKGGGIGTYWGAVRSIGEKVGDVGQTSGIIPFVRVMDSITSAVSQGNLRRGSAAVYIDVHHPEIEEFLEIRKPAGDFRRKALDIHNAVVIDDKFMHAVRDGTPYDLISPRTGEVIKQVDAFDLWTKILETRLNTGEPYIMWSDTANRALPAYQKALGLRINQSNLCSEIMLATDRNRTAVCCLSSLNIDTSDQWYGNERFMEDVMRFLDNVLQDFIDRTLGVKGFEKARYSAMRERAVGLGVMGFHSYLQSKMIAYESRIARSHNLRLHRWIKAQADAASVRLAHERGPCPDAADAGVMERFSHKLAVAPTASISIICGNTSPCKEPWPNNIFTQKTLSGSFTVTNRNLEKLLESKGKNTDKVWASIVDNNGSVQHLDFLSEIEKKVYRTSLEVDQVWVIRHHAEGQPYVCQGQSVNLAIAANTSKLDLHDIHWLAWESGCKALYYLRSISMQRATNVDHLAGTMPGEQDRPDPKAPPIGEICEACQ